VFIILGIATMGISLLKMERAGPTGLEFNNFAISSNVLKASI
jgi:hypothetical protein